MDIVKKKLCEIARVIIMFMYPTLKEFYGQFFGEIKGGQKYYTEWFDDMQQK